MDVDLVANRDQEEPVLEVVRLRAVRAGVRRGGRLKTVTSTTVVTVDDSTNTSLPSTNNAKLSVVLPDGTVETKDISSVSGATITVAAAIIGPYSLPSISDLNIQFIADEPCKH